MSTLSMLTKAYVHTVALLESLKKDERGVTAIEYAVIAAAVAAVVIAVFGQAQAGGGLFDILKTAFDNIANQIQ